MGGTGGTAVPLNNTQQSLKLCEIIARDALQNAGFVEGEDYKIATYSWEAYRDVLGQPKSGKELKRITFFTDEAFIMAKMIL